MNNPTRGNIDSLPLELFDGMQYLHYCALTPAAYGDTYYMILQLNLMAT